MVGMDSASVCWSVIPKSYLSRKKLLCFCTFVQRLRPGCYLGTSLWQVDPTAHTCTLDYFMVLSTYPSAVSPSAFCPSLYTLSKKNPSAWNFLSPEPEVTNGAVAIIIRVVLLSPYLRIRGVSLSSIHYNQSHRVYINRRQQCICLIWN